ncbi:MAG: T9SS type A sorting domain-containing protein [Ignavibacteria bacterium]
MKTNILITTLIIILALVNTGHSQIIPDYPFKTFLDNNNNLYITGNKYNEASNSLDIIIEKYDSEGDPLYQSSYLNPFGTDRGIDLAVDHFGNVVVTGYVYNNQTASNDIIILYYNSLGIYLWDTILENFGDDKGMGIDITTSGGEISEIYITGYITNAGTGRDCFTAKYLYNGTQVWQRSYDEDNMDNFATDIHLDDFHAYVSGSIREKDFASNDVLMLTYYKNGNLTDSIIYERPGSSEIPVSFSLVNRSQRPVQKSRSSLTCVTDNIVTRRSQFLTIFFDEDINHQLQVKWANTFTNGEGSHVNVPTSLTVDQYENVYVTGYCYNYNNWFQSNGLDFTTIKYTPESGKYGWKDKVMYYNHNDTSTFGVNDKASSIKLNSQGDIFVAGSCQGSDYGYAYDRYRGSDLSKYSRSFIPSFISNVPNGINLNKCAALEIATDGTPLMIVMGWNESSSYWAAQKYDADGNIEYTIDNGFPSESPNTSMIKKSETSLENSPNPFNPSTVIKYILSERNNRVQLKVYNMLGMEISTLVNEIQKKGSYKTVFNASGLSSGIYFYKLILNGIPRETKKMMLIK